MATYNGQDTNLEPPNNISNSDTSYNSIVFPYCVEKLPYDYNLIYHDLNFQSLMRTVNPPHPQISLEFDSIPSHPPPLTLLELSDISYKNLDSKSSHPLQSYLDHLVLPPGWQILTLGENRENGYFGAVFWHSLNEQLVIASRGTEFSSLSSLLQDVYADVKGIVFGQFIRQMNSAVTFTYFVAQEIRKWNNRAQIFLTGHSLGGWLTQVCTFALEFLYYPINNHNNDNSLAFLKNHHHTNFSKNISRSQYPPIHAHAIAFDFPGCAEMLHKLAYTFNMERRREFQNEDNFTINVDYLDITSYLSASNRINTCNTHFGTVYRIFPQLTKLNWLGKIPGVYDYKSHTIKTLKKAFDTRTGMVIQNNGKLLIHLVVDWPHSFGIRGGKEYRDFFKWTDEKLNFHVDGMDKRYTSENSINSIRCRTIPFKYERISLTVFEEREREFLNGYQWLRDSSDSFKPHKLFDVSKGNKVKSLFKSLTHNFGNNSRNDNNNGNNNRDNNTQTVASPQSFHCIFETLEKYKIHGEVVQFILDSKVPAEHFCPKFIPFVKRLLHHYPDLHAKVHSFLPASHTPDKMVNTSRHSEKGAEKGAPLLKFKLSNEEMVSDFLRKSVGAYTQVRNLVQGNGLLSSMNRLTGNRNSSAVETGRN